MQGGTKSLQQKRLSSQAGIDTTASLTAFPGHTELRCVLFSILLDFANFPFRPSMSAVITLSLFSSGSKASLENFLGGTSLSRSVMSLYAGTSPRLTKHPSIRCIEFVSDRVVLFFNSRSKQNGESFSHIQLRTSKEETLPACGQAIKLDQPEQFQQIAF
nr:hypothetical protein Iba_chr05dCG13870 [Ipomoea batatas]